MNELAMAKLLDLTRRMVRQRRRHGTVQLSELIDKHGGGEYRELLGKLRDMLEVWIDLYAKHHEQEPAQFASGFGASDELSAAFAEAITTWKYEEAKPDDSEGSPQNSPLSSGAKQQPQSHLGEFRNGQWIVTGQSLVAVKDWSAREVGGQGEVNVGVDMVIGDRPLAVKTPLHASFPRFAKEVKLTGSLVHPHIIPVYCIAFDADAKPSYIMPKIGKDKDANLFRAITVHHESSRGQQDNDRGLHQLLAHVVTTARTMHFAHTRTPAAIHRDLKPHNLLLDGDGNLYVADWGLGYREDEPEDPVPLGTFEYAAPEQFAGKLHGKLADVYSLGAILYHVVTGRAPFAGSSHEDKLANRYASPKTLKPALDPELAGIIRRAMATDTTERYPSAQDFADDLERVMGRLVDEPVKAFKPGEEPWGVKLRRKIRRHAGAVFAILALLVMVGILGLFFSIERHVALKSEERRRTEDREEARRKLDDEKVRATALIGEVKREGEDAVSAVRLASDDRYRKLTEDNKKAVEGEQHKTRSAEAERDDLRRQLNKAEFRASFNSKVQSLYKNPKRELSEGDRELVRKFTRQIELELADAEVERLALKRELSQPIASYALRETILGSTDFEQSQRRPELQDGETLVLEAHAPRASERDFKSSSEQAHVALWIDICEYEPKLFDQIRRDLKPPHEAIHNPGTLMFYSTRESLVSGGVEGVSRETAQTLAERREFANAKCMLAILSGKSLADALQAAWIEKPDEYFRPDSLRQADAACVQTFNELPSDEAVVARLSDHTPRVNAMAFHFGPHMPPPGSGPPAVVRRDPVEPNPGGSPAKLELHTQEEFAKMVQPLSQAENGKGVAPTDFALEYTDLLPSQVQELDKTAFHFLTEEALKHRQDLPEDVIQRQRHVGSAEASRQRAYDIDKLKGFHRVGAKHQSAPFPLPRHP